MLNPSWFNPYRGFGYALALLAGAAMPLGFAPFHLFPVPILSLAVLFLTWKEATPWAAFRRGWVFGLGMFGLGVSWVYVSFHQFGHMHPLVAGGVTALFVMFLALFPAILGYAVVRLFPCCNRVRLLLVAPAFWILLEWVRSWFLTGFPWLFLGYSQLDSPLGGLAPIFGVYGVGWASAFTASLLVYAYIAGKKYSLYHVLPALIALWGVSALLWLPQWSQPHGEPIKVGLVQGNISQEIKWRREQAEPTLDLYQGLSEAHYDADLLIWPETAIPLFKHQAELFLSELEDTRLYHQTDFITGLAVLDPDTRLAHNSVISISERPGLYYKRHLVPFGEYVPLRSLLGGLLDILQAPMSDFSPGPEEQKLLYAAGQSLGISICYEDAFPGEIRRALPEATLLVNLSNDAWFGDSIAPHQHLQIARMRALETGRYLLRATNTGISAIIDPKGRIIARAPQFEPHVLRAEVQPRFDTTPYALSGDGPVFLIMLACLAAGIILHYYWIPAHSES